MESLIKALIANEKARQELEKITNRPTDSVGRIDTLTTLRSIAIENQVTIDNQAQLIKLMQERIDELTQTNVDVITTMRKWKHELYKIK